MSALSSPVLEYVQKPRDKAGEWALRTALWAAGAVVFMVAMGGVFAAACRWYWPDLLSLYPLGVACAVIVALTETRYARFVGLGAVAGSVLVSTAGYAVGMLVMVRV